MGIYEETNASEGDVKGGNLLEVRNFVCPKLCLPVNLIITKSLFFQNIWNVYRKEKITLC